MPTYILACLVHLLVIAAPLAGAELMRTVDAKLDPTECAAAWGVDPGAFRHGFADDGTLRVDMIASSAAATLLAPNERWNAEFQLHNQGDVALRIDGDWRILAYETFTKPTSNFHIGVRGLGEVGTLPIALELAPGEIRSIAVDLPIPERFGGYAVMLAREGHHHLLAASVTRARNPELDRRQFRRLTMDIDHVPALVRLGVAPNRMGVSYKPTTDADFAEWYEGESAKLRELHEAGLCVTLEFGSGSFHHPNQPLGRPRPWLDDQDQLLDTKFDLAWLPDWDADFRSFVTRFLVDHGWPNGPVNGVMLWNEPWEGISISGWGADMLRYRAMYQAMGEARDAAAEAAGVQVLVGGCDSSSNTYDKLFPDGSDTFDRWFDFMSIHYQGTDPHTTVKRWLERKDAEGNPNPVRVWDTESWVANSDERIPGVLAAMCSFGQDRVVGVDSSRVVLSHDEVQVPGEERTRWLAMSWSPAAAIAAFSAFVGERPFRELLFRPGLPFCMVFDGEQDPEDGTVVVVGDLGTMFGYDSVALRSCRSLVEVAHERELRAELDALAADDPERERVAAAIAAAEPITGARLQLPADPRFALYDGAGNALEASDGMISIPLGAQSYYARGDGKEGSFAVLTAALAAARIEGYEPFATVLRDSLAPIGDGAVFTLALTNVLNRPVTGQLAVEIAGLQLEHPSTITVAPHATEEIPLRVTGGTAAADNRYPARITIDCGADGLALHDETLRVNLITRQPAVSIDGSLGDWSDALPQPVSSGSEGPTMTEQAWLPFKDFTAEAEKGLAVGYLGHDDDGFLFAAKISDRTPHPGTLRFAQRFAEDDWDEFFYPKVAYELGYGETATGFSVRWQGVVIAPTDGDYLFTTRSDDGIRVSIDGQTIIENWTGHPPTEDEAVVALRAGEPTAISVEYFQGSGGGTLRLSWTPPGGTQAIVPASALRPSADSEQHGLQATFFHGTELAEVAGERIDPVIDYPDWKGSVGSPDFGTGEVIRKPLVWPEGVRRYSYRQDPELPAGNAPDRDNVQIAFNVLDEADKPQLRYPRGTFADYTSYSCSDYEFALNTVRPEDGGGFEIWRLRSPSIPHKHFYPRQPSSPADGAAAGQLVTVHQGDTRITECRIAWSEIPEVKAALDAGRPVKVSFRINDSAGVGCMELSRERSVARRNGSFRVDWKEHWANELRFGWR